MYYSNNDKIGTLIEPVQLLLLLLFCEDHLPQLITVYVDRRALRNVSECLEKKKKEIENP